MSRLRNIPGSVEVIGGSAFVIHDPEKYKGDIRQVFDRDQAPLFIEIGMGKGRFLMDMAERYPDRNFIGIEMYDSVLFRALQKAEIRAQLRRGVPEDAVCTIPASQKDGREIPWPGCNFRFIRMDARHLTDVFATGEVSGIYLNFSDPWPKERHGSRRLTSENFLRLYEQILSSGGRIEFKTDNRPLFDFSLEQVRDAGWQLDSFTYDLHHDPEQNAGNIMTEYEEKFSAKGNPICKLTAHPAG